MTWSSSSTLSSLWELSSAKVSYSGSAAPLLVPQMPNEEALDVSDSQSLTTCSRKFTTQADLQCTNPLSPVCSRCRFRCCNIRWLCAKCATELIYQMCIKQRRRKDEEPSLKLAMVMKC